MIELKNILLVVGGSAIGGGCRYLLSMLMQQFNRTAFPAGTFLINTLGCFLIGIIYSLSDRHPETSQNMKILLASGFCGGFTTFSAFAIENLELFKNGNTFLATLYIVLSVLLGVSAAWAASAILK